MNDLKRKELEENIKMKELTFSKIKYAVLFVCSKENSRKEQLECLTNYCNKHRLAVLKTFECDRTSQNHKKTFDEMVKYVKSKHAKIAIVTYDVSKLQTGFKQSACLNDLRNKKGSEIHFYKEDLIVNRNSLAMDIARCDYAILANKMYINHMKDNVCKSIRLKNDNVLKKTVKY